jgi:hypothetical protein
MIGEVHLEPGLPELGTRPNIQVAAMLWNRLDRHIAYVTDPALSMIVRR